MISNDPEYLAAMDKLMETKLDDGALWVKVTSLVNLNDVLRGFVIQNAEAGALTEDEFDALRYIIEVHRTMWDTLLNQNAGGLVPDDPSELDNLPPLTPPDES